MTPEEREAIEAALSSVGRDYAESLVDRIRWLVSDYGKLSDLLQKQNSALSSAHLREQGLREALRTWFQERIEAARQAQAQYERGATRRGRNAEDEYQRWAGQAAALSAQLQHLYASLDYDLFALPEAGTPKESPDA